MTAPRIAVAMLLAAALVGCGDDEERLSAEEWVEQADAICAEADEEVDELFADVDPETASAEELGELVLDEVMPRLRQQIEDIGDLSPPEDIEDEVDELLEAARTAADDLEELAEDDPEALLAFEEDPFADVNERSAELGLTDCAD